MPSKKEDVKKKRHKNDAQSFLNNIKKDISSTRKNSTLGIKEKINEQEEFK